MSETLKIQNWDKFEKTGFIKEGIKNIMITSFNYSMIF